MDVVKKPLPWVEAFSTEGKAQASVKEEEVGQIPWEAPQSSTEFRILKSFQELKKLLEEEADRVKRNIEGVIPSRLEETRQRAEVAKRIREALVRSPHVEMMGRGAQEYEAEVSGLQVEVNPNPEHELEILEEAMKSLKGKLEMLANVKRVCENLFDLESSVAVEMLVGLTDGVPTRLILNI